VSLDLDQLRVPAGVGPPAQLFGDVQQQVLVFAQLKRLGPQHHAADGEQRGEAVREQHEGLVFPRRAVAHAEAIPNATELAAHDGLAAGSATLRVHVPGSVCGCVVGCRAQEVALVALAGGGFNNAPSVQMQVAGLKRSLCRAAKAMPRGEVSPGPGCAP
jgi:hypothetical protein